MMRRSFLLLVVAAAGTPALALAQDRALSLTPRAGYVLGSSVYSQFVRGEQGATRKDELRVDGHLAAALTAAYRLGRSPFSLFADAGTGTATAVSRSDRTAACAEPCTTNDVVRMLSGSDGPITLWHAAAGLSARVEDRRGSGGTINFMVGSALTVADFKQDFDGNAFTPRSYRAGGYFLGVDVTHPLTSRVQLRGGVSDIITRISGPELDTAASSELKTVTPTVSRSYTNRVRLTAGVSVGL